MTYHAHPDPRRNVGGNWSFGNTWAARAALRYWWRMGL